MIVTIFDPMPAPIGNKDPFVPGIRPDTYDISWAEFVEALCGGYDTPRPRAEKCNNISYCAAEFQHGTTRAIRNALHADWIGLDIDTKPASDGITPVDAWTFADLKALVEAGGWRYMIYTTTSATDALHNMRLILPLSRRVAADEWPRVWGAFNRFLGGKVDASTKDISRALYAPRIWEGAYNDLAVDIDGPCIDADAIMAAYPDPAPPMLSIDPAALLIAESAHLDRRIIGGIADIYNSPIVSPQSLQKALGSKKGGRMYSFLVTVALTAMHRKIEITQYDLADIGRQLASMIIRDTNHDLVREAGRALRFAEEKFIADKARQITRFRTPAHKRSMMAL